MHTMIRTLRGMWRGDVYPLEDAFRPFIGLERPQTFHGSRDDHTLLAAFLLLRTRSFRFAPAEDCAEFKDLLKAVRGLSSPEELAAIIGEDPTQSGFTSQAPRKT